MPSGNKANSDEIIDYINNEVADTGLRPTHQKVADEFDLQRATISKVVNAEADTDRIHGEPRKAGRIATDRRPDALNHIRDSILKDGWAPSQRELADYLGCSVSATNGVIAKLAADGLIEVGPNPRQIRIVGSSMKVPEVAL